MWGWAPQDLFSGRESRVFCWRGCGAPWWLQRAGPLASIGPFRSQGKLGAIVNVRSLGKEGEAKGPSSLPHPVVSAGSLQWAPWGSTVGLYSPSKAKHSVPGSANIRFCCPCWSGIFYEMVIYVHILSALVEILFPIDCKCPSVGHSEVL